MSVLREVKDLFTSEHLTSNSAHPLTGTSDARPSMLPKQTWTKRLDQKDESKPNPQARAAEERFWLRVDRQEK